MTRLIFSISSRKNSTAKFELYGVNCHAELPLRNETGATNTARTKEKGRGKIREADNTCLVKTGEFPCAFKLTRSMLCDSMTLKAKEIQSPIRLKILL